MTGDDPIASVFMSMRALLARAVSGIVPPKEIEDIVQETYVRACQANNRLEIRSPRSFLYRTAKHLALDYVKSSAARLNDRVEDEQDYCAGNFRRAGSDPFEVLASNEEFSMFCDAVRHLPAKCRLAFVLKKVYGYTQREIAAELDISESTVEKHVAQGVKRCARFMKKQDTQPDYDKHGVFSRATPNVRRLRPGDSS